MKKVIVLTLIFLLLATSVAWAKTNFQVFINGKQLLGAKIINGITMVPLRTIAKEIGANLRIEDKGRIININIDKNNQKKYYSGEMTLGQIKNYDSVLLGPSVTLKKYLLEKQEKSFYENGGQVMLKYEILDANTASGGLMFEDPSQGFKIAVREYFGQIKKTVTNSAYINYYEVKELPNGERAGGRTGPVIVETWYQDTEYQVLPKGNPKWVDKDGKKVLLQGLEGWQVIKMNQLSKKISIKGISFTDSPSDIINVDLGDK